MISLVRAFSAFQIVSIWRPCGYLQIFAAASNKSIFEAAKLPSAPKKPLTSYLRFLKEVLKTVIAENPGKKIQEINKIIGEQYKNLEDLKKKQYEEAFKRETEEYHKQKLAYLRSLTPEMREKLENTRKKRRKRRFGIEEKEKMASPFQIFVTEQIKENPKESSESIRRYLIKIKQKWHRLSPTGKHSYANMTIPYVDYEAALKKLEEKKSNGNGSLNLYEKASLPSPPKKPLAGYLRFLKEVRPSIAANNPGKSQLEINSLVGEQWRNLDDSKKKELQKAYQQDYYQYIIAMHEYRRNLSRTMKLNVKIVKQDNAERRARKLIKQRKKDLGKPKKPPLGFAVFVGEKMKEIPKEPNKLLKDYIHKIKIKWNKLSENEKNSYIDAAAKELDKYNIALAEWESQMIAQGHFDVVRNQERLKKLNKNQESN